MLPAKAPSGIPIIDETWGGLYRGGAYLLYGRAQSGNRLLALQLAQAAVEAGETCLFISPSPLDVLTDRAARLGLDVNYEDERLRMLHIAPMSSDPTDEELEQALTDLTSLIRDYAPSRLVIDDFEPFTRFQGFERFANAFFTLLDRLTGATLILAMHAPPNLPAEHLIEFVQAQTTGVIELTYGAAAEPGTCTLVLRPGRFHSEGARIRNWDFGKRVRLPKPDTAPAATAPPPEPLIPTLLPGTYPTQVLATVGMVDEAPEPPDSEDLPGIHFFEFDDSDAPSPEETSPVPEASALEPPALLPPDEPPLPDVPPSVDPFEYALLETSQPSSPAPPLFSALPAFLSRPPSPTLGESAPRRQFIRAFEAALVLQETASVPFLALALRMAPGSPVAQDFSLVIRGMRVALGDAYVLLADTDRQRLVALLPGHTSETAATIFTDLKQFLYDVTPDAHLTFEETSATVLSNGRPFHTVDAFLAHTFDN